MKRFIQSTILSLACLAPALISAHEGHDQAPGQIVSENGGIVKPGTQFNLEMVSEGTKVSFYPLAHGGGKIPLAEIKATATAQTPKGQASHLKLEGNGHAFVGAVELGGANRADIEFKAIYKGKSDIFKFQVEKQ